MTKEIKLPQIEISLRWKNPVKSNELYHIRTPKDAELALRQVFNADTFLWQEEMIMLCLNSHGKIIGFYKVSSGGLAGTIIDPKIVFSVALNCGATGILIAHNHPSGNLTPSQNDIKITEQIKQGAKILDIAFIDHMILTDTGYYSFQSEGNL